MSSSTRSSFRKFSAHYAYTRKVGTRIAQAISKLSWPGSIKSRGTESTTCGLPSEPRVPALRLHQTEEVLRRRPGAHWTRETREAIEAEVAPIDDIRSSAALPAACRGQSATGVSRGPLPMNPVLARWHALPSR